MRALLTLIFFVAYVSPVFFVRAMFVPIRRSNEQETHLDDSQAAPTRHADVDTELLRAARKGGSLSMHDAKPMAGHLR